MRDSRELRLRRTFGVFSTEQLKRAQADARGIISKSHEESAKKPKKQPPDKKRCVAVCSDFLRLQNRLPLLSHTSILKFNENFWRKKVVDPFPALAGGKIHSLSLY